MNDYETLFFLERQEAFWKGRKLSGKAGSFLVYHEASDGPFWALLGPLALLDPLGPLGPLALGCFFLKALSEHWTCLRRELVFQFWTWS